MISIAKEKLVGHSENKDFGYGSEGQGFESSRAHHF